RERSLLAVPDGLAALVAALPGTPINSDQWKLLQRGSVAGGALPGIEAFGLRPRPLGLFLDRWRVRFRKHGRFTDAGAAALGLGGRVAPGRFAPSQPRPRARLRGPKSSYLSPSRGKDRDGSPNLFPLDGGRIAELGWG